MKRHIHYILIYTLAIIVFFPWTLTAFAEGLHDAPYDFLFGNHIDTHQRGKKLGDQKLKPGEEEEVFRTT